MLPNTTSYEKIYTGSSLKVKYLQTLLEDSDIQPIIRNDEESARRAGFGVDYNNGVHILVHKDNVLIAKRLVDNALDENGDIIAISEEELNEQAMASKDISLSNNKSTSSYRRSPLNLLINILIIIYSLWKLSPLLRGEELPIWRIALSIVLIIFCAWALIAHFTKSKK